MIDNKQLKANTEFIKNEFLFVHVSEYKND